MQSKHFTLKDLEEFYEELHPNEGEGCRAMSAVGLCGMSKAFKANNGGYATNSFGFKWLFNSRNAFEKFKTEVRERHPHLRIRKNCTRFNFTMAEYLWEFELVKEPTE